MAHVKEHRMYLGTHLALVSYRDLRVVWFCDITKSKLCDIYLLGQILVC